VFCFVQQGWWPSVTSWPNVHGEERRHKVMGTEVQEQETYGVDYVTGRDIIRCLQDVLPEYTEDDLWEISDRLMVQVSSFYLGLFSYLRTGNWAD